MCVYVCMLQALACMYYMHKWSKYVLWQRFWLDLCTIQVVTARACAYQLLHLLGIKSSGMGTVQAGSCLSSEQIDTLFICVGGQEGGWGGGNLGPVAQD